ncbi:MAG: ABC transporter ATP-binding protein [Sedimentisphaerales bacterium]|nr:ABC transporter ATP-binding protein [Sedimentisphaerales bacterium]
MAAMTASIQVQNVSFCYPGQRPVLEDISFTLPAGQFLAIVGPNGAGKSTLINLIAGALAPRSGTIFADGIDIRSCRPRDLAQRIAIVRQGTVPAFGFSVAETVLMARTAHYGPLGFERPIDRQRVAEALEMTATAELASRPLANLSGGERQRVFIARALAQETPILLMDEPTSFLDLKHQVGIYDLLKRIQLDQSRTVIAITQDVNLAAQYCDQTLLLRPLSQLPLSSESSGTKRSCRQYRIGPACEVLTAEHIKETFGVGGFSGRIGTGHFFIPLGHLAKDANPDTVHPPGR